jgi:acetoin utilization deacetylase AcuC-like enzyme
MDLRAKSRQKGWIDLEAPVTTLILTHPSSLLHDMGPGHPERPDRIRVIQRVLEAERFQQLARDQAPAADMEMLLRVHPREYIDALREAVPAEGLVQLDQDTILCPDSFEAALHAAGGACRAVDEVMQGLVSNAFVATRPPGHHAERSTPMGFCFFNNAAIAARHAQAIYGIERVAIFDFDVHHGNGTQDIFWSDASVLYCSTHEAPLYPGTGSADERGAHNTIVNAPLKAGATGEDFAHAITTLIVPRIDAFAPQLIILSAGFDAHQRDPLAHLNLTEIDFGWATKEMMSVAQRHCSGKIVSLLEGGYDLDGLARSVAAHVMTLMNA